MKSEAMGLFQVFVCGVLLVAVFAWKLQGCPNGLQAVSILGAEGYTEVKIDKGGHGFSCGKDGSATGFAAKTVAGHPVKGVVCCGLVVKACTMRITEAGR
jgi:hypothetical protein